MAPYLIETNRSPADLRKCSLSGFRKSDVLRSLTKALRDGDLPAAQRWGAEMIGSHLGPWMVSKLVTAWWPAEVGVLAAPTAPAFLHRLFQRAHTLHARLGDAVARDAEYRFLCARLLGMLSLWPKRACKLPKITSDDFRPEKIQEHSLSKDSVWAQQVLLPGDPLELCIPINELAHHILRSRYGTVQPAQPVYWLLWYLEWIRWRETSEPGGTTIAPRPQQRNAPEDPCWLLWELFSRLGSTMGDAVMQQQVAALQALFALDYKKSKRAERKYLLIAAVELLATSRVSWDRPLVPTWNVLLASEASIDWVYRSIAEKAREWEKEHSILVPRAQSTPLSLHLPMSGATPAQPRAHRPTTPATMTKTFVVHRSAPAHAPALAPAPTSGSMWISNADLRGPGWQDPPATKPSKQPKQQPMQQPMQQPIQRETWDESSLRGIPSRETVGRRAAPHPPPNPGSGFDAVVASLRKPASALDDPSFLRPEFLSTRRPKVSIPLENPSDDDEPALIVDLIENSTTV